MADTPNYNLPYPDDYTQLADVPAAVKALAEATEDALGEVTPQNMEVTTNKVTSLSSSSTDTQYPSAKCVYNELSNKQAQITSNKTSIENIAKDDYINMLQTTTQHVGEYYTYESHNTAQNADFSRWDLIPVKAGVTYYFRRVFGNFTSVKYSNGTFARITTTVGMADGSFTATMDGEIGITAFSASTYRTSLFTTSQAMYNDSLFTNQLLPNKLNAEKTFVVDKNGKGDFRKLTSAINFVNNNDLMDVTLLVGAGTWDIIDELGSAYIETININNRGIYLKNRIHLIFASNSKVVCNYTGTTENVCRWLSPFNAGKHGFTLENCRIEASKCLYCVHDERDQNDDQYTNNYINCSMHMDNSNNPATTAHQCIGGGLGLNGHISIKGCDFESVNTSTPGWVFNPVSYHNSAGTGKSRIDISNCYFKNGTIRISYYGTSTQVSHAFVSNCSLAHEIVVGPETSGSTNVNVDVTEWNNIIRT